MSTSLENFIDKKIFLILRDAKTLALAGIDRDQNVVTLKGCEQRQGIWVEIECLKNCPVKSGGENVESSPAIIFIPWHFIVSMVYFPGKQDIELELPQERKVGFRQI